MLYKHVIMYYIFISTLSSPQPPPCYYFLGLCLPFCSVAWILFSVFFCCHLYAKLLFLNLLWLGRMSLVSQFPCNVHKCVRIYIYILKYITVLCLFILGINVPSIYIILMTVLFYTISQQTPGSSGSHSLSISPPQCSLSLRSKSHAL